MSRKFYNWLIMVFAALASLMVAQLSNGMVSYLFQNDQTPISFIISIILFVCTVWVGWKTWIGEVGLLSWVHFAGRHCITLGLLGTVVGLVILTSSGIDSSNIDETVKTLKSGMGTALLTTATGIIASLLLEIQLALVQGPEGESCEES